MPDRCPVCPASGRAGHSAASIGQRWSRPLRATDPIRLRPRQASTARPDALRSSFDPLGLVALGRVDGEEARPDGLQRYGAKLGGRVPGRPRARTVVSETPQQGLPDDRR